MSNKQILWAVLFVVLSAASGSSQSKQVENASQQRHVYIRVEVATSVPAPLSGRLLIFIKKGSGDQEVDANPFHMAATWVAAKEVRDVAPGSAVEGPAQPESFVGQDPAGSEGAPPGLARHVRGRGRGLAG